MIDLMQKNIEDYHKDNNIQYKTKLKDIGKYIEDKNERIVNKNNQNIECSSTWTADIGWCIGADNI